MSRPPYAQPLALASAVLALGGVALAWWLTGGGIASPGGLSASAGDGAVRGGVARHAELERRCEACHPAPWSSATTSERCVGCHDEIASELAARDGLHGRLEDASRCLPCHTEHRGSDGVLTRLEPALFPHEATGFSLASHERTADGQPFACRDCHDRGLDRFDAGRCAGCHSGYQPDFLAGHVERWGDGCRACHDGVDRFGHGRFDHRDTALPLTGAHAKLGCAPCHGEVRAFEGFSGLSARCASCHAKDDAHAGRFGDDCGRCHDAAGWKPARFDHATTRFPLTGAHERASCASCHRGERYAGTPTNCVACHQMPADHAGTFGDDCASCHGTDTWSGARFDHRFPLDHGARGPSPCATCHPDGYRGYTCYGCHEHTPANVAREHHEEGIADLSACARCHPTGREKEGKGEGREREREGHGRKHDDD